MAASPPDVLVVIPTYRRDELLVSLLDQLERQDYSSFEVIIADQNPDHSPEVMRMLSRYRRVILKQPSLTRAKNLAIKGSRGEIILTLDDDVTIRPDLISRHVAVHRRPEVDVVGGVVEQPRPRWLWSRFGHLNLVGELGLDDRGQGPQAVTAVVGAALSFKREVFDQLGGFDESFTGNAINEDTDFCWRAKKLGFIVWFDPEIRVIHGKALGGTRPEGFSRRWYRELFANHLYFYLKHYPKAFLPLFFVYRLRQVYSLGRDWGFNWENLKLVLAGYREGWRHYFS